MTTRPSFASPSVREFELVVLLAVLALGEEAYPMAIRDEIERRSGRVASRAAVFITLERLEDKGLVSSRFGDPTPVRGGRAKRFFRTTPTGVRAARQSVAVITSMSVGLKAIVKPR